jgi:hypothetical protein
LAESGLFKGLQRKKIKKFLSVPDRVAGCGRNASNLFRLLIRARAPIDVGRRLIAEHRNASFCLVQEKAEEFYNCLDLRATPALDAQHSSQSPLAMRNFVVDGAGKLRNEHKKSPGHDIDCDGHRCSLTCDRK